MTLEEIKQELIDQSKDPNDFNIKITENGHSITPKWFYENKKIAKQEDEPIIESVDTTMLAMVDVYEDNLRLEQENTSTMLALTDLYEMMLGG